MAQEVDTLALAMIALQLRPDLTNEELAQFLGLQRALSALSWKVKALSLLDQGQVTCETCGTLFLVAQGYYESGEYAYCSECCHW